MSHIVQSEQINIENELQQILKSSIQQASNRDLYYALLTLMKNRIAHRPQQKSKRKIYYISCEFLIGKLLSNNLVNLAIYEEVCTILNKYGKNLGDIEEIELEPSLGNGGLGRLAACFLDSIATHGIPSTGIGLNYQYGLFRQNFKNNIQTEEPNPWIEEFGWLNKRDIGYDINIGGHNIRSQLYDIDIVGHELNQYSFCELF